jgi:hypothetical protein
MENNNEPLEILKAFINERYQFNTACQELNKIPGEFYKQREGLLENLDKIFEKYLTLRDRIYARSLTISTPSTYNLETNEILSCNIDNKKAYIEVQETVGFKKKLKYTLHLKKDGWKIDKKETYVKSKNKWEKDIL